MQSPLVISTDLASLSLTNNDHFFLDYTYFPSCHISAVVGRRHYCPQFLVCCHYDVVHFSSGSERSVLMLFSSYRRDLCCHQDSQQELRPFLSLCQYKDVALTDGRTANGISKDITGGSNSSKLLEIIITTG